MKKFVLIIITFLLLSCIAVFVGCIMRSCNKEQINIQPIQEQYSEANIEEIFLEFSTLNLQTNSGEELQPIVEKVATLIATTYFKLDSIPKIILSYENGESRFPNFVLFGSYNCSNEVSLYINNILKMSNSLEKLIDTLAHELAHDKQWESVLNGSATQIVIDNFYNNLTNITYTDYINLYIEKDARTHGAYWKNLYKSYVNN